MGKAISSPIRILCSTDDNYVPYGGIMLTSLFENNREETFEVYILTRGIGQENARMLRALGQKYGNAVIILPVDLTVFDGCPIRPGDHVTLETYFRLLAPQLLPEEIDRILYLDVDMVIDGPVRALWDWNVEGYALGAVMDESFCKQEIYQRLRLNPEVPYFNAGVLLLNLKYWRENGVSERCMACIRENADRLLFHDQDTLNIVLKDERTLLPITYNFQTGYYLSWIYPAYPAGFKIMVQETAKHPTVIHYAGPMKPWMVSCYDQPYRYFYRYYKKLSPWKDFPPVKDTSVFGRMRLALGQWGKALGLITRKYEVKTRRKQS